MLLQEYSGDLTSLSRGEVCIMTRGPCPPTWPLRIEGGCVGRTMVRSADPLVIGRSTAIWPSAIR